jgi:hypothetical protein
LKGKNIMSDLSRFLHNVFGIEERHIDADAVIQAVENAADGKAAEVAGHLNLDEAKALAAGAEIIKEAAVARIAELTAPNPPTP